MNHAFVDGNKRAGLAIAILFIGLNGAELTATVEDAAETMIRVAEGERGEDALAEWFAAHARASGGRES